LPFGTIVKVTNKKNSKSVIVKINDRGPFVRGRIVDLSGSAFSSIANLDAGVIEVKIEVIR
jgi:rare lipoprotein A